MRCSGGCRWPPRPALRHYGELGELDGGSSGWYAEDWVIALDPYFAEHGEIGTGPDACGPATLLLESTRDRWSVSA